MANVLVFGHQNPDNDAIMSAVVLSQLLNQVEYAGNTYEACALGQLPAESAKLLADAGIAEPRVIDSVEAGQLVVLTDHNESAQSVAGLKDATVFGVVDHHRIGDFETAGPLHYTIYNDTFGADGQPVILSQSNVDISALADVPLSLPQPEAPAYGAYQFLGWVARYDTSAGQRWTRVKEPLTAAFAARIKPGEDGVRTLVLRAAWRRTEESRYPWTLRLDDGATVTEYDAAVPMASGGSVYLCAYPEPVRAGYRFTGWYSDYDLTRPWDFNAPVTADMTLYAAWQPLPPVAEESTAWKPKKLPWWRRAIAAVCGAGALAIFWLAAKHTDLTALVGGGTLSQAGWQALGLYGLFIALLFGCIAAIGRRSKPLTLLQTPVQKRRLSHRTRLAAALILLCIPATLYLGFFYLGNTAYYPIAFAVLLECMVPFFLVFEGRKPQARELVLVASLCALGVAGRAAFFMLPQFKPVLALTIISGVALGGETGFLVGAMTMLASNVLFSQGPWTPFQMFAMGIIGFLAGVLFRRGWLRRSRAALCVFGAISAVFIYGGVMNPVSALLYARTLEWKVIAAYYVTGFPMDCVHAAATVFFLLVLAEPMLEKLDRIKIKYGLVE